MIVVKLVSRTHQEYLIFVTEQLQMEYGTPAGLALLQQFYSDLMFWITPIDLSATASLMRSSYSSKTKGRKPRDPADMLRSLLLMTKLGMSVDDWVRALRTTPVYAILSGFVLTIRRVSVLSTISFERLWNASTPHKTGRMKRRLKKPRKKGKKNEKQEPKNPKITEKLVSRVLREGKIHYAPKEHDLLQQLFQTLFVLPSAAKGLLGDTNAFRVIGDGSPVETGARSFGKFLCDCRKTGNWKCGCKRQFADPDADWGWDSYRERYYYGRTLYMFCAADSPYNLPVYPRLFRASQHDTVSWICGYREFRHWYPQWKLGEAILDSAHDALPIYTMLEHDDVSAIIDLNPRRSGKLVSGDIAIWHGRRSCLPHWSKDDQLGQETRKGSAINGVVRPKLESGSALILVRNRSTDEPYTLPQKIIRACFRAFVATAKNGRSAMRCEPASNAALSDRRWITS